MNEHDQEKAELHLTPAGQVLILNANLAECFPENISEGYKDMRSFVKRLPLVVPYAPDILLLQELVKGSTLYLAQILSEETGFTYEATVCPEEDVVPFPTKPGSLETRRDCAVLINTSTIRAEDRGGYIASLITREEGSHERTGIKEHAYQLVSDKRTGTHFPLVSLHLLPSKFYNMEIAFAKKGQWTKEICEFLDKTYSQEPNQIKIIAGDFNNRRCVDIIETFEGEALPFWKVLTELFNYMDTVFKIRREGEIANPEMKRIDYIFTRGADIIDAASDLAYTKEVENDPEHFYSDHRMNWALLKTAPIS